MMVRLPLDCERAADSHRPIGIANGIAGGMQNGAPSRLSGELPASVQTLDPQRSQPTAKDCAAGLEPLVQKRA